MRIRTGPYKSLLAGSRPVRGVTEMFLGAVDCGLYFTNLMYDDRPHLFGETE